jgi:hypothetical protein
MLFTLFIGVNVFAVVIFVWVDSILFHEDPIYKVISVQNVLSSLILCIFRAMTNIHVR